MDEGAEKGGGEPAGDDAVSEWVVNKPAKAVYYVLVPSIFGSKIKKKGFSSSLIGGRFWCEIFCH